MNTLNAYLQKRIGLFFILLLLSLGGFSQKFDKIITNGRVIDGSGNPWFYADLGIKDGKIIAIGKLSTKDASEILDATIKSFVQVL